MSHLFPRYRDLIIFVLLLDIFYSKPKTLY